ncbi:hydrogen peroxide-inducible genes activator [Rhizobium sp. L1K21]|uniref:hydrogen peroxide-inducible genes activator n=1 Tax=Rhizobium sp. L1K21 TaxID=2954933 RepID=UPI00209307C6|nr:hydrogen peroxide-inducible genes activator [Rhizobium sp. L1K21]MCO6187020.1 hydrogen peroxide-inducible genes activator [Rhizobium sp. L1K21]
MITIRQMRYFEALASVRHFGKAAELVNVSQPALSAQIRDMEEALGVSLVERSRAGTFLTAEGEELLPEVRQILSSVERLMMRAKRARGLLQGRLRLGIIPTVAPYLVPVLIPALKQEFPDLDLELKEVMTDSCIGDLRAGKLDCAIVALPLDEDQIKAMPLFKDRFLIASAEDENTVLMSPITQDQVDVERLLLLEEGHCLRDQALAVCGTSAKRKVANYGATSMATLLQMVSHGMGITLIPEIAARDEAARSRMRIVPFADPQPFRQIGLVWRRADLGRRADFEAFGKLVTEAADTLLGDDFE